MSESYELVGQVKEIMEMQTFGSGFTKHEFVVTSEDKYPQDVKFECVKDRIRDLKPIKVGMRVTVKFNVRGNEHNGRYYVNLQAWGVIHSAGVDADTYQAAEPAVDYPTSNDDSPDEDMPF